MWAAGTHLGLRELFDFGERDEGNQEEIQDITDEDGGLKDV